MYLILGLFYISNQFCFMSLVILSHIEMTGVRIHWVKCSVHRNGDLNFNPNCLHKNLIRKTSSSKWRVQMHRLSTWVLVPHSKRPSGILLKRVRKECRSWDDQGHYKKTHRIKQLGFVHSGSQNLSQQQGTQYGSALGTLHCGKA